MPWRLIEFIIIFAVFLVFIAFNLGNKCDISFGFKTFSDVPVFLTAFASFFLGMICAMPFVISARAKRKAAKAEKEEAKSKKKGEKKAGAIPPADSSFSDGGPYGIN
jgi:uncharacterized integral membrane protein